MTRPAMCGCICALCHAPRRRITHHAVHVYVHKNLIFYILCEPYIYISIALCVVKCVYQQHVVYVKFIYIYIYCDAGRICGKNITRVTLAHIVYTYEEYVYRYCHFWPKFFSSMLCLCSPWPRRTAMFLCVIGVVHLCRYSRQVRQSVFGFSYGQSLGLPPTRGL